MKINFRTSNRKESVTSKTFKIVSSELEGVGLGVGWGGVVSRKDFNLNYFYSGTSYKKISLVIRTLVYQETLHDHS